MNDSVPTVVYELKHMLRTSYMGFDMGSSYQMPSVSTVECFVRAWIS